MPNPDTSRRKRRVQVNTTSASETSAVVARPVDLHVAPRQKTDHLLASLQAINPTLTKFANAAIDEDINTAKKQAEAMRQGMSNEEAQAYIDSPEFAEQEFMWQRSFMLNHGKMDGRAYRDSLTSAYDSQFNPDVESIDDFKSKHQPQPRSQDADYLEGFNHYSGQGLESVDSAERDRALAKVKEDISNATYQNGLEYINDAAEQGRTISPVELQIYKEDAEVLGMSKKEAEINFLNAVDTLAVEGRPELYDIFYEKRVDGSPGLAHTTEYGERIAKSKAAAQRIKESAVTKESEAAKFEARLHLNKRAEQGLLTVAETQKFVDTLGAATAMSYYERSQERAEEIAQIERMSNDIRTGLGVIHKGHKDFQTSFDGAAEDILKENAGNPNAISHVVDMGIMNGAFYSPWEKQLKAANPLHSQQFEQAAFLFQNIKAANPAYAAGMLPERQKVLIDTYNIALREGATKEQALELAQRIGTPEAEQAANAFFQGEEGRNLMAEIDSELVDDAVNGWIDSDAENLTYIRRMVREKVRFRVQKGMNPQDAKESAFEDFKNTHVVVKGRYIYTGRNPLAQNNVEGMEEYLEEIPDRRRAAGMDVDEEGYYFNSDERTQIDGTYAVHDSTGFPTGTRFSLPNYIKGKRAEEAQKMKEETIAEQEEYMRDQEGLKTYQETAP